MTILVTGAGGAVGGSLIRHLVDADQNVRAAGRHPESLTPPHGVETVHLDLAAPAPDLDRTLAGVDAMFLYADASGLPELVPALRERDVFVVLLSSDSINLPDHEVDPVAQRHEPVERALDETGVRFTALRPGTFDSLSLLWADDVRTTGTIERAYPDAVLSPIHPDDVAETAAFALLDGRPHDPVTLHGPEPLTSRDQIATLADVLGVQLRVVELSPEQAWPQLVELSGTDVADSMLRYWSHAATHPIETTQTSARITGRPSRTFREWAEEHRDEFR